MHPSRAYLYALLAFMFLRVLDRINTANVQAGLRLHLLPPFEFGTVPFTEVSARGICRYEESREIVFR